MLWRKHLQENTVDGDGHCILYSVQGSLIHESGRPCTTDDILRRARIELEHHFNYYQAFTTDDDNIMSGFQRWAETKSYNHATVDLVLHILCNALAVSINIMEQKSNGDGVKVINTLLKPGRKEVQPVHELHLLRRGLHYSYVRKQPTGISTSSEGEQHGSEWEDGQPGESVIQPWHIHSASRPRKVLKLALPTRKKKHQVRTSRTEARPPAAIRQDEPVIVISSSSSDGEGEEDDDDDDYKPTCSKKRKIPPLSPMQSSMTTSSDECQIISDECEDPSNSDDAVFQSFYENNMNIPVYKYMSHGIDLNEAAPLLLRELPEEHLASQVPVEIQHNVSFVYSTSSLGHWKNCLSDSMGAWKQTGTFTKTVQFEGSEATVVRRNYVNLSSNDLHRTVIKLQGEDSNKVFVQYYFDKEEHPVSVKPHGNSKNNNKSTKYTRTKETTKERIKDLGQQGLKPKRVFHQILEEEGGLGQLRSSDQIPRHRQQVSYFTRKDISNRDPLLECADLAKSQQEKGDKFLRDVGAAPEFTLFVATDRQLQEVEKFCTYNGNFSILGVDTTFNIGRYYVTLTTYRHLMLQTRKGVEPVMLGPALIHQKKSFDSYFKLSSSMLKERPAIKNLKVFGTDGDVNLSKAFEIAFSNAKHLLCDIHMVDNIECKLRQLGITGKTARNYVVDIFGETVEHTKMAGLVDCSSGDAFDAKLARLASEWKSRHPNGGKFHEYFAEYKADLIKNCMSAELRSLCGLGYPPKPYTQNANECANSVVKSDIRGEGGKKSKLDPFDFVQILHKSVKRQATEVDMAIIGLGEYRLKPEYRNLQITDAEFWKKTKTQREAFLKR